MVSLKSQDISSLPTHLWKNYFQVIFMKALERNSVVNSSQVQNYKFHFILLSVLSNYMVWRTLKEVVPLLDRRFRKTYYRFKEKIQGPTAAKPRRKICFGYTDNILGPLLGSLFVRKAFSPESKVKVSYCPNVLRCYLLL